MWTLRALWSSWRDSFNRYSWQSFGARLYEVHIVCCSVVLLHIYIYRWLNIENSAIPFATWIAEVFRALSFFFSKNDGQVFELIALFELYEEATAWAVFVQPIGFTRWREKIDKQQTDKDTGKILVCNVCNIWCYVGHFFSGHVKHPRSERSSLNWSTSSSLGTLFATFQLDAPKIDGTFVAFIWIFQKIPKKTKTASFVRIFGLLARLVQCQDAIDVDCNGSMTWEEFTAFLVDQGMAEEIGSFCPLVNRWQHNETVR